MKLKKYHSKNKSYKGITGYIINIYNFVVWNKFIDDIKEFKRNNGHCNVPSTHKLYKKCTMIRKSYSNKELSVERINQLKDLGFRFNINSQNNDNWEFMFNRLKDFAEKHNNLVLTSIQKDKRLAKWVNTQKKAYKKDTLSQYKYKKLSTLGVDFCK